MRVISCLILVAAIGSWADISRAEGEFSARGVSKSQDSDGSVVIAMDLGQAAELHGQNLMAQTSLTGEAEILSCSSSKLTS